MRWRLTTSATTIQKPYRYTIQVYIRYRYLVQYTTGDSYGSEIFSRLGEALRRYVCERIIPCVRLNLVRKLLVEVLEETFPDDFLNSGSLVLVRRFVPSEEPSSGPGAVLEKIHNVLHPVPCLGRHHEDRYMVVHGFPAVTK